MVLGAVRMNWCVTSGNISVQAGVRVHMCVGCVPTRCAKLRVGVGMCECVRVHVCVLNQHTGYSGCSEIEKALRL